MLKHFYDRVRLLGRGEWLAIAMGIAILAVVATMASGGLYRLLPNFGFGSDWNCSYVGKGEPVCVKQTPAPTAPRREAH
jgi:hypothetical protein